MSGETAVRVAWYFFPVCTSSHMEFFFVLRFTEDTELVFLKILLYLLGI